MTDVSGRHDLLQQQQQGGDRLIVVVEEESWLVKSAKKLKEVSEVLAGPKWKNFIRRLSKCGRYADPLGMNKCQDGLD
ncbi:hypothetical protein L484_008531 [Morus notabilis]|uniref:Uncharacterized protein n=1 Tax=Morus notabilis TaxID=981085 RepID=W9RLL7_9ROSA|nr:hypothetical protein L484_008531 [Morus notabilis]